jgi:5-methylcytosine-specific restriction endonuclease McrA
VSDSALKIIGSDKTFTVETVRGESMWVGKCLFCNAKLAVPLSGRLPSGVTVEHILSRHHGGMDTVDNLALACSRCNNAKGIHHDHKRQLDARGREVVEALLAKRHSRMRAVP